MDTRNCLLMVFLIFLCGNAFSSGLFDKSREPVYFRNEAALTTLAGDDSAADSGAGAVLKSEPVPGNEPGENPESEIPPFPGEGDLVNGDPVEGDPSFRLSESDTGLLFFQRLTWEEAQYAVRYTVILERKRENTDSFVEVLRRNVDVPYTDISVPPGEYRYSVMSFNILGLLDFQTDWEYFTVLQAFLPAIVSFTPEAFYFDRPSARIITLIGENLLPEAEIYLVSKTMRDEAGEPLILRPREIYRNELGENARLLFLEEDLIAGEYDFVVKNPGGLETTAGAFVIALAKPFDINVSGGYAPMLTIFGRRANFLDHVLLPLGFQARGSFIPVKMPFGNFGPELNAAWSHLTSNDGRYRSSAHLVLVHAGALFEYWILPKELSVNGRAGLGVAGIFDFFIEDLKADKPGGESMNNAAFSFSFGASVQWLFYRQFFIEGGVDYVHVPHREIPMGFARFGLSGGYQF